MEYRKQINNIVVLGSNGMLGYAVTKYYKTKKYNVIEIDRSKFNALTDDISILKPHIQDSDFIVNCIGIIKPRISSMNSEDVLFLNGTFPKNLAKLANSLKLPCFHITTDCVYSGAKGKYSELDIFDIRDLYGLSKNAGENADCMTLRTSIIGPELNNKYSLLEWAISQKGKAVKGFTNHIWNGVTTICLAEVIEKIYLKGEYVKGIYHIHSPGSVTKSELLNLINENYKLNLRIEQAMAPNSIDRSLNSIYQISAKYCTKSIAKQIEEMHNFFAKVK